jgi:uncharacterized Zn finger protein (UPF0148 family)
MHKGEMDMFCPMCGAPNEEDAIFCGNCGAALTPEAVEASAEEEMVETAEEAVEAAAAKVSGDETVAEIEELDLSGVADVEEFVVEAPPAEEMPEEALVEVPPPPPPPPSPPSLPTSGLAIASLVLGVGGLFVLPLIGSILAIIFGYMARRDIRHRPDEISGDGLALVGLVTGWIGVGLALVGLLIVGGVFGCGLCATFGQGSY